MHVLFMWSISSCRWGPLRSLACRARTLTVLSHPSSHVFLYNIQSNARQTHTGSKEIHFAGNSAWRPTKTVLTTSRCQCCLDLNGVAGRCNACCWIPRPLSLCQYERFGSARQATASAQTHAQTSKNKLSKLTDKQTDGHADWQTFWHRAQNWRKWELSNRRVLFTCANNKVCFQNTMMII